MKTIVIYYSYSGHTKMIANRIKEKLNCDIQEIVPIKPYSSDYQSLVNNTEDNLQSKVTPEIKPLDIDLSRYDKIIIGTPVWWYTITPPVRTFLKNNDLTGKIVIPFATNAGWLGQTFEEFQSICNGNIKNEKSIKFSMDYAENKLVTSPEEIDQWIENIDLVNKK